MKTIHILALVTLVFVLGLAGFVPAAQAACSDNGYYHSRGNCDRSSVNRDYSYSYAYAGSNYYSVDYLQQYIRQLQALLEQLQRLQTGNYYPNYNLGNSEVDVSTRDAVDISDTRATLRGVVDFNDSDEAVVYFNWGRKANDLRYTTTHLVLDEDDDTDFQNTLTDLNSDITYYYRAVAEDEDGRRAFGSVVSFETDEEDNDNNDDSASEPDVETDNATAVDDSSAELNGSVDMNDFSDGEVFFVYGEDRDQVEDVAHDYDSYAEVDEDGDDLQKVRVDTGLDGAADYSAVVTGLNDDTDIYFSLCVGYDDEDDDATLQCGETENFTTDN